ncbi:hypothetical protein [Neobacillus vireti]|uniref:Uncharacterized protein n=1 Tax=Neobacillus vireti LMG 21834 TaxID=1131730 RepID=A0AB94IFU3_9BACI|nr:hypothetical protein [Neobacillus vireti]ETI65981.1 hypothetical protein BAVI_24913 [Neobacillus vireti LMG 21834]KLT17511.1 hypothetical protein AA980_12900 [Neobacillus vireti]
MGFKRFLKKSLIPGYDIYDITKKIKDNGLSEGIKERFREDLEDTPVISQVYQAGKYEGKKEGYVQASFEYEKKLIKQADTFLKQKKNFESERMEYEQLLDEYENYITEMSNRNDLSAEQNRYLQEMILVESELKRAM